MDDVPLRRAFDEAADGALADLVQLEVLRGIMCRYPRDVPGGKPPVKGEMALAYFLPPGGADDLIRWHQGQSSA